MKTFLIFLLSLALAHAQEPTRPPASASKATFQAYATALEGAIAKLKADLAAAKLDTSRLAEIDRLVGEIAAAIKTPTVPPPVPPVPSGTAPTITVQPVGVSAAAGATVFFEVTATGAISFQWSRDGIVFPSWTSARLTLSGITTNDAGAYKCEVTNSAGTTTSSSATLTITAGTEPPVTTLGPDDAKIGTAATFLATAEGDPATWQWKKDGAEIPGATSATLSFPSVAAGDSGDYTAVATNGEGSASNTARLNAIP